MAILTAVTPKRLKVKPFGLDPNVRPRRDRRGVLGELRICDLPACPLEQPLEFRSDLRRGAAGEPQSKLIQFLSEIVGDPVHRRLGLPFDLAEQCSLVELEVKGHRISSREAAA
ncbi:MAG TPA: hypothetical protein VHO27_14570 [Angustibacter sp.]|nr:hypothetical protein [Angustibacter sp.]